MLASNIPSNASTYMNPALASQFDYNSSITEFHHVLEDYIYLLARIDCLELASLQLERQERLTEQMKEKLDNTYERLTTITKKKTKEEARLEQLKHMSVRSFFSKIKGTRSSKLLKEENNYKQLCKQYDQAKSAFKENKSLWDEAKKELSECQVNNKNFNRYKNELEELLQEVFDGPTPNFPQEDALEQQVTKLFLDFTQLSQVIHQCELAKSLLRSAHMNLVNCFRGNTSVRDYSTTWDLSCTSVTKVLKENKNNNILTLLSDSKDYVKQATEHIQHARVLLTKKTNLTSSKVEKLEELFDSAVDSQEFKPITKGDPNKRVDPNLEKELGSTRIWLGEEIQSLKQRHSKLEKELAIYKTKLIEERQRILNLWVVNIDESVKQKMMENSCKRGRKRTKSKILKSLNDENEQDPNWFDTSGITCAADLAVRNNTLSRNHSVKSSVTFNPADIDSMKVGSCPASSGLFPLSNINQYMGTASSVDYNQESMFNSLPRWPLYQQASSVYNMPDNTYYSYENSVKSLQSNTLNRDSLSVNNINYSSMSYPNFSYSAEKSENKKQATATNDNNEETTDKNNKDTTEKEDSPTKENNNQDNTSTNTNNTNSSVSVNANGHGHTNGHTNNSNSKASLKKSISIRRSSSKRHNSNTMPQYSTSLNNNTFSGISHTPTSSFDFTNPLMTGSSSIPSLSTTPTSQDLMNNYSSNVIPRMNSNGSLYKQYPYNMYNRNSLDPYILSTAYLPQYYSYSSSNDLNGNNNNAAALFNPYVTSNSYLSTNNTTTGTISTPTTQSSSQQKASSIKNDNSTSSIQRSRSAIVSHVMSIDRPVNLSSRNYGYDQQQQQQQQYYPFPQRSHSASATRMNDEKRRSTTSRRKYTNNSSTLNSNDNTLNGKGSSNNSSKSKTTITTTTNTTTSSNIKSKIHRSNSTKEKRSSHDKIIEEDLTITEANEDDDTLKQMIQDMNITPTTEAKEGKTESFIENVVSAIHHKKSHKKNKSSSGGSSSSKKHLDNKNISPIHPRPLESILINGNGKSSLKLLEEKEYVVSPSISFKNSLSGSNIPSSKSSSLTTEILEEEEEEGKKIIEKGNNIYIE